MKNRCSINTVLDPEMYEKVRTGEAFIFTCPECGHKAGVDYGCLYSELFKSVNN